MDVMLHNRKRNRKETFCFDKTRGHQVMSPVKNKQRTLKRSVHFAGTHQYVSRGQLLEEHVKGRWYQSEEYRSIMEDIVMTFRALERAAGDISLLDPSKHCLRGLESYIFRKFVMIKRSSQRSIVLCQQKFQLLHGLTDEHALQFLSMKLSKHDDIIAIQNAKFDSDSLSSAF
jgi:hypothetical protein